MEAAIRQVSCLVPAASAILAYKLADDSGKRWPSDRRLLKSERVLLLARRSRVRCETALERTESLSWLQRIEQPAPTSLLAVNHFFYRALCHKRRIEDDFILKKELGHGAFGTVYLAENKALGYLRAVKKIEKHGDDHETLGEIYSLMDMDHPHITKLTRVYDSDTHFYIVLELCSGPDLLDYMLDYMIEGGTIPEPQIARIMRHILKAVHGCHSQYTVHADVKPENFMFTFKDCNKLKMIDLGLCSTFKKDTNQYAGTIDYSAPEVSTGTSGPEADIWSCGVVLFYMATGAPLFGATSTEEEIEARKRCRKYVKERIKWAADRGVSKDCVRLLSSMLCFDRHMRVTAKEALAHPFIQVHAEGEGLAGENISGRLKPEQIAEARQLMEIAIDSFDEFGKEPVLVRVVLILMTHLGAFISKDTATQRSAFAMLDRRGRGELSLDSLEEMMALYNVTPPQDLAEAFQGVDLNGNGYLTYTTFMAATLPIKFRCQERLFKLVFELLDTEGNGFINPEELAHNLLPNARGGIDLCRKAVHEISGNGDRVSFDELFLSVRRGHPICPTSIPTV